MGWLLAAIFSAQSAASCFGFALPSPPEPLTKAVKDADVILQATIISETADSTYREPKASDRGYYGFVYWNTISKPGRFVFSSQHVLKGVCPEKFAVDMPLILSSSYGNYGEAKLKIGPGQSVLLLLRKEKDSLTPVDPALPLIPLAVSALVPEHADELASTVGLVASSLGEVSLRQADTFVLRNATDRSVVLGLVRYLNDADPKVVDNVLYAMAVNQQLEAIPRIRAFAERYSGDSIGVQCPMALDSYTVPEAVSNINPLLFSRDYFVRLHAMFVLDGMADRTSIPYLFLALSDPDSDHIIDQSAYGNLHRLIPSLGEAQGDDYFSKHSEQERQKLFAWWADDLDGKHASTEPASPTAVNSDTALLFVPVAKTREEALKRLAVSSKEDKIPYMILGLEDPDPTVAMVAITALRHTIPELKIPLDSNDFRKKRAEYVGPAYGWWQKHLSNGS